MTQNLIMGILAVAILLLLAFIGYYAFRLAKAGKAAQSTAQRFQLFMQRQDRLQQDMRTPRDMQKQPIPDTAAAVPAATAALGAVRVFDRELGLGSLSSDPIFIRKAKEGDTTVQIGNKPSVPLGYVLEPRTRRMLNEVVGLATGEFGLAWAVLAQDGADGKLTVTRLV